MRKYMRATSVNDNGYRYFELSDQKLMEIRTKHLLVKGDFVIQDVPVFKREDMVKPYILINGNTSSLYTDAFRANFLWFDKNQELIVRFFNDNSA